MILRSLWNPIKIDKVQSVRKDVSTCTACGGIFTPSGLRMHQGSKKCSLATKAKPLRDAVEHEALRLQKQNKRPIYTNVALALQRRKLEDICGIEIAPTKLLQTDMDCKILDEYWVYDWVGHIWMYHNKTGYTRNAYSFFEKLNQMSEEDAQSEIGLVMLNIYG